MSDKEPFTINIGRLQIWPHFEPRDMWVGVYWNRDEYAGGKTCTEIYVCILPMFPIRFMWYS